MKRRKSKTTLFEPPTAIGTECNCGRCGVRCRVGAVEPSKAKMLRRSTKAQGYCNNCAVTEFLANTYPPNMIIEESQHGAAILLFPQIQEQFAAIMAGRSDMTPEEINWQTVVLNWDLPLKVKHSPTNPHLPGDSVMRKLAKQELGNQSIGGMLDRHFKETVPGYRTREERIGWLPEDARDMPVFNEAVKYIIPYTNCQWCKGQGVADARVRRRRGWPGSDGPRGPCTFCSVEREKEEQRQKARAQEHFERTGDYCEPGFSGTSSFYMVDVKTGKVNQVGSDGVQELDSADVIEAPVVFLKPNCACCGRSSNGQMWCDDCEAHIDPTKPYFEQAYFAQYHEDCPFQIEGYPRPWL